MLGSDQSVSVFQEDPTYAPAIILSYPVNILLDIFQISYSKFDITVGATKGTGVIGTACGYREQEAIGFTGGTDLYHAFVIHDYSLSDKTFIPS
jgi:hypothetical protein